MVDNPTFGTINGMQIIGSYIGGPTGEQKYVTADGRVWTDNRGLIPSTLPAGAEIGYIKRGTGDG